MKTLTALTVAGALALVGAPAAQAADAPATPTPSQQCKTERAQMGKTVFAATYGTNKNKANAFGKCVSKRTTATAAAEKAAKTNAAKDCKAERTADPVLFAKTYGTGKNGKNAYGKCVSSKAKAKTAATVAKQVKADVNAAKACRIEQKAGAEAFKETYGSNKNKSNAFGKCVSAKAKAQTPAPATS